MYEVLYNIFFVLDVLLIVFLIGISFAFLVIAARNRWKSIGKLRLIIGGFAYLLVGAVGSLFATSYHQNDPTIFLFPPGLGLMAAGILGYLRDYSRRQS